MGGMIATVLGFVGRLAVPIVARVGWPIVSATVAAAVVALWLGAVWVFGGPSPEVRAAVAEKRAAVAETVAAVAQEGSKIMDTALTLAQLAETAAGAEREARAALDAAASEADVAVGAATAGGPGDNVCFDAATVRLLNK